MPRPTLHLTVGLPGVGKTTEARRIAARDHLLRLTPDEWMAPLFGHSDAAGRRNILEGRFIWVAHEVLAGGSSVVLDFGCWSPEERWAVAAVAAVAGAEYRLVHLELTEAERRARAARRWVEAPDTTFEMTDAHHDHYLASFVPPTPAERAGGPPPAPPAPCEAWLEWASQRWPTLPRLDTPPARSPDPDR
ncbi:putative kinase [Terracoccus luteus]|uniref:Putative kinase n=1 Tax=Terracoccus luteus TaxID=53356 RepID=A0A495XST5_9MICO|nr:AAA family ATPase [Terracoccus luteus]RKT77217.1 putative kinase [Terracoccus luteus]